jgi:tungstate transport system substrate-binding protein
MVRKLSVCVLCLACLVGCSSEKQTAAGKGNSTKPQQSTEITLATTTSTQDSGLLEELMPIFVRESGVTVKVVAVGSGQAMELGRRGDADVLLVHSPEAEQKFMDEGYGLKRLAVMHNDFVIVGPAEDSANIKGSRIAADAFKEIAEERGTFISRGDDSGTHKKESEVWRAAGIEPDGNWYISAGVGMAQALRIANEKKAYILSDRATYLALKDELELAVLVEGDDRLLNRYSVITIDPAKHPHVREREATQFADFLISPEGQKAIGDFGVERFGQSLFVPDAL